MKRQCLNLMVLALITLLSACEKSSTYEVTHLPYQADEESRWGLIDWEGNPLIEDEFEEIPSPVVEGRFYVKNRDDLYEFYTAEKKFKKIGGEYISVGVFHDGLAPVVEPNQPISYIHLDGTIAFKLDRYKDELIIQATVFQDGRAAFMTQSGKRGYIDKTGKVVIEPKYDSASLFCGKTALVYDIEAGQSLLINLENKELLKGKDNQILSSLPWHGTIIYTSEREGNTEQGVLNQKGEIILKSSSKYKGLKHAYHNSFVFTDSHDKIGLVDAKGTVLIRSKYDLLIPTEDVLIYKENGKFGIISYSGEKKCNAIYEEIIPFADHHDFTYAKDGDDWIIIDKNGADMRKGVFSSVMTGHYSTNEGSTISLSKLSLLSEFIGLIVSSDYLDVQAEVDKMLSVIHTDGSIDKLSYNTTSRQFAQLYDKDYTVDDLKNKTRMEILTKREDLYKTWVFADFNDNVISPRYKRVWKDSYWGGGHWENEIEGYDYNYTAKIESFSLIIELQNKFQKQNDEVHQAVCNWFEARSYSFFAKNSEDNVQHSFWIKNSPSVHAGIHYSKNDNYIRIDIGK